MSNTGSAHLVSPFLTVLALFVLLLGWVYGPSVRARLAGAARLVSGQVQGGLLILFVVVLWTSSSVAIQMVFEAKFDKPFFLTYASASLLMVYLPFYPDRLRDLLILARQQLGLRPRGPSDSGIIGHAARGERPTMWRKPTDAPQDDPLSTDECMEIALRLGFIWFMLQVTFNVGLRLSSVSSVTIISASSSLWTLVIGAIRERERPSLGKLFAVLLTFGGVVLVMLAGAKRHQVDTRRMLWGDLAALFSAIAYGLYAVSLRAEVPSEGALPMPLLFGLIGLACFGLTWPLLVILHLMGLEPFSLPPPPAALAIAANALVGTVLANMLLARAMLLASPLLATVGLSLAIPLAMLSDVARHRITHFSAPLVLGSLAVWAGFFAVGASDWREARAQRRAAADFAEMKAKAARSKSAQGRN